MAQETLVKQQIDDGWSIAVQFNRDVAPVDAAFWARTANDTEWHDTDEGVWYLHLVTSAVDTKGWADAYRALSPVIKTVPSAADMQFKVKLLSPNDSAAKAFLHGPYPSRVNQLYWQRDLRLGNLAVSAIYSYPRLNPFAQGKVFMTHDEIKKTLLDLLGRMGPQASSVVTLQDGTSFQGIPFGIEVSDNQMTAKFIDGGSHLPRVVAVNQIASIQ
jgi:hypothetical protein